MSLIEDEKKFEEHKKEKKNRIAGIPSAKLEKDLIKNTEQRTKHMGLVAAEQALKNMIERAFHPTDPNRDDERAIFNKFTSSRIAELIYLGEIPKLDTIENVIEVEQRAITFMAMGKLTPTEVEKIMSICRLHVNALETRLVINEVKRIKDQADRGLPVQEMLNSLNIDMILEELTSRKLSHEDRIHILTTIKDNILKNPG